MVPPVGTRVYRVAWRDGRPFIQTGRVIEGGGGKRKVRKTRWDTTAGWANSPPSETMKGAIRQEIITAVDLCIPRRSSAGRKQRPFSLALAVADLMRLYRKLQRHHLAD